MPTRTAHKKRITSSTIDKVIAAQIKSDQENTGKEIRKRICTNLKVIYGFKSIVRETIINNNSIVKFR